jgi:hypothetical protein
MTRGAVLLGGRDSSAGVCLSFESTPCFSSAVRALCSTRSGVQMLGGAVVDGVFVDVDEQ